MQQAYSPQQCPVKPSMMDQFNEYAVFQPGQAKVEAEPKGISAKVSNFFGAIHNTGLRDPLNRNTGNCTISPIADRLDIEFDADIVPARVAKFMTHQATITLDPIAYAKGKGGQSIKRRVFDLAIGGSIAAIAETLTSIALLVFSSLLIIPLSITGIASKVRGEKDPFEGAIAVLILTAYSALSLVKSVSRIVPVAGAFLGYGVGMVYSAAQMGTEKIITAVQDCRSREIPGQDQYAGRPNAFDESAL